MNLDGRVQALRSSALDVVRRGPREVLWTPEIQMGLGNHLYFWLWAHTRRAEGTPALVLERPTMTPWLPCFPTVHDLIVGRDGVRVTDRRVIEWNQSFGEDFSREQLHAFISARVLPAEALSAEIRARGFGPGTVVINVRRGDYYSNEVFRGRYGFDVIEYLREAAEIARAQAPVERFHVVSDDVPWCRERLDWLAQDAVLTFAGPNEGPIANFGTLAAAHRLILANSTFSYWGAYTSNVVHRDNARAVIAPAFHARHINGGRAWQLDPEWTIVEDIRGGWNS